MKSKYVEYNLSEVKLRNLIMLLQGLDQDTIVTTKTSKGEVTIACPNPLPSTQNTQTLQTSSTTGANTPLASLSDQALMNSSNQSSATSQEEAYMLHIPDLQTKAYNTGNTIEQYDDMSNVVQEEQIDNETTSGTCSISRGYGKRAYKDPLYEDLKKNKCKFTDEYERMHRSKNMLAEYQYQRNTEELNMACARGTHFLDEDANAVYPPQEWMDKEIKKYRDGIKPIADHSSLSTTNLKDFDKTRVGSIMPRFVYQEQPQRETHRN